MSRTERHRKTKIGTEVAHITRDSLSSSKCQRSRSPDRFAHRRVGASGGCSGGRGNVLAVGNCCYVAVCSAAQGASAPTGEEWVGDISWRPPAYNLLLLFRDPCIVIQKCFHPIRINRQFCETERRAKHGKRSVCYTTHHRGIVNLELISWPARQTISSYRLLSEPKQAVSRCIRGFEARAL